MSQRLFLIHRTRVVGQEPLALLYRPVRRLCGHSLAPRKEFARREGGGQEAMTRSSPTSLGTRGAFRRGRCEQQAATWRAAAGSCAIPREAASSGAGHSEATAGLSDSRSLTALQGASVGLGSEVCRRSLLELATWDSWEFRASRHRGPGPQSGIWLTGGC